MKTSSVFDTSIGIRQYDDLSQLINSQYVKSCIPSFLALLSTVLYRHTYNEVFRVPVYSYTKQYTNLHTNNNVEELSKDFIKKSFVFDSNINYTLDELSKSIKFTLESSSAEKITTNDDSVNVLVLLSEKMLSQQIIDDAKALRQMTKVEFVCIITNSKQLVEISFLNTDSSRYQLIPEHLYNLANNFAKNPSQCIHYFNILSPDEIKQQLILAQGEKVKISDRPIYKNIEFFATKTPNTLAISAGQKNLTYGQLNCQANQLAHFFLQFPIAIGDKIVAFLPRSTDIINTILAIHKVGAVYIPIDPTFPKERILAILQEVKPQLILTCSEGEEVLENIDIPKFNLEYSAKILNAFPVNNPDINVNLDDESHIFFTSGTTGKPKGVVATQRNLVQYLSSARNKYKFSSNDRFISTARFTFSISLFKILTPLYVGGSLRIVDRDIVLNLSQLCKELQGITVFHFGPSLLKQLLPYIEENFGDFSAFNNIRHVSSGGDMVPPEVLEKLKKIFINAEVYVIYGSSEISCMGCTYEVSRNVVLKKTKVGKPHQNMSVRIFDKYGNMVPIGAPGKLYFAGDGLVKGYLNLEKLTAEKFIEIDGERFYSIGDIGRFDSEGNIELLGRDDFQVQIRGMRVELPEIEYYLKRFPGIVDCVVVSKILGKNIDTSLIAYLVFQVNSQISDAEIREYLNNFLPDYMIPNIFVQLEKLPTNLNGKIDRSALPAPVRNNNKDLVKPRNVVETHLFQIWQDVLGFPIGIDQDFISLGGHSLQATQIVSRAKDIFHVDIPISLMLQNNQQFTVVNIISLAEYITNITQSENFQKVTSLQPVDHSDELPLTSYQERIWLLSQISEKYAIHNLPMVFQLEGELNITFLEEAFNYVIQRHESLRTIFPLSDHGLAIQKILPEVKIKVLIEEVTVNNSHNQNISETIDQLVNQEVSSYFDLQKDILIRVKLLKLGEDNHVLIITCHHIISDGWSLSGILLKEISAYYNHLLGQGKLELPELKINFGDYTFWHQQQEEEKADVLLEYWTNQLQGSLPLLSLPTDNPRPNLQTFQGSIQYFEIEQQLREKIENLAKKNGATLFMVLLAAFQIVLHRYSNQEDIVIGTPIGNRTYTALENIIGCFINVVPLRSNIENNPSFLDFLTQIKQVSLDAYTYSNFPVEKMLSTLKDQRDTSYSPWFQVLFILLNVPNNHLELPGVRVTEKNFDKGASTFDLTFLVEEKEAGLKCSFEYNTVLYNEETISRLIGHFQVVLEAIISNPQTSVQQLPLLTEREKQQLLIEWNQTTKDYPKNYCIHQLFQEQVQKTPDAIAVIFAEEKLTYRQLNHQANQLAHYLQSLGVGPEVLVGISVERSLEMIVGLFGILKAGGAYVPLDPSYPAERVEYILANSEAAVLVTVSQVLATLPKYAGKVICLDRDLPKLAGENQENPDSQVKGENLSYVIYTSGSTGKPKGVQICHQSLVNFIYAMKSEPGLHSNDRLVAVTTISFDIHTLEIYLPLTVGATIILASRQITTDGVGLAEEIAKHDVTVMQATPATWRMLLTANWSGKRNLKAICGGEALPQSLANDLLDKVGSLWNIYGPTETTVWSTTGEVKADRKNINAEAAEPIGWPIANTEIYILDKNLQPLPIGIPGELHIGGDGLARGYIKRPELNAEKFISNPFSNQASSRLYKTGDLVRYLPDGNIEYIGRIDNQVKIRGFRIELGEIEAVLLQHPQIREGAVIAREDNPGDKRLVAYYVAGDTVPAISELRDFLKQKLPNYMMPSAFVLLESLPLTPNGKIDRKSLPNPNSIDLEINHELVGPQDEYEKNLVNIWQEVLNLPSISIQDNFFDIGGNSLLAVRLSNSINSFFQQKIPLGAIFQFPTIEQLANLIKKGLESHSLSCLALIQKGDVDMLPLFLFQGIDIYRPLALRLGRKQPVYGLSIEMLDKNEDFLENLEKLAAYYIVEMKTVQPDGPYLLGGISFGGMVALEVAQQLQKAGETVAVLALFDTPGTRPYIAKQLFGKVLGHLGNIQEFGLRYLNKKISGTLKKWEYKYSSQISNIDKYKFVQERYLQAQIKYQPQAYKGQVTLFLSTNTNPLADDTFVNLRLVNVDPLFGWGELAIGGLYLFQVPGGHISLLKEPNVQVIAERLKLIIAAVNQD